MSRFVLLPVFILISLSGCAASHMNASALSKAPLPQLIVERLAWMDDVARAKQAKSLPVNDPKREAEVLAAMSKLGAESGVPAPAAAAFYQGQMDAAKTRQEEWLATHPAADQAGKPVPDLVKTVRPALDQIGKAMMRRLAEARHSSDKAELVNLARLQLTKAGVSKTAANQALQGLAAGLK